MGTKKQTVRNRFLAFAVVMVYVMALLPSFAFAAASGANITDFTPVAGTKNISDISNKNLALELPYGTDSTKVTMTLATGDAEAISGVKEGTNTVTVSGTGSNEFTVEKGKTYVISTTANTASNNADFNLVVTQAAADDNKTLSGLVAKTDKAAGNAFSGSDIVSSFAGTTLSYTATVAYDQAFIKLTPTVTSTGKATVKINGAAATDATATSAIALNTGVNNFNVEVTAQNGDKQTYTLAVTRTAGKTVNQLKSLNLKQIGGDKTGSDLINFAAGTTEYNVTLPEDATSMTIEAELPANSNATITKVDGTPLAVNQDYAQAPLAIVPGTNPSYTVKVTPEDTTVGVNTYKINVIVPDKKDDASLKGLELKQDAGRPLAFTPAFNASTLKYSTTIAKSTKTIYVKKDILSDPKATMTFQKNGTGSALATAEEKIDGVDYIKVDVTSYTEGTFTLVANVKAQNETVKKYTIAVTRLPESTNTTVSGISLSGAWTSAAFNADTTTYTGKAASNSMMMTVTTEHPFAKITINGADAVSGVASKVMLPNANNEVKVEIKAEDGTTFGKTYIYKIEKDATFAGPANVKLKQITETTATFTFIAPKGMDKVAVYYKAVADAKFVCGGVVDAKAGTITIKNLQPNTPYQFKVTAGKVVYGKNVSYIPLDDAKTFTVNRTTLSWNNTASVVLSSKNADSVTVAYQTVTGATNYALYYKENGVANAKWTYGSKTGANGGALTAKGLDSKKKYDFAVTSGKMLNGKVAYLPLGAASLSAVELNTTGLPTNVVAVPVDSTRALVEYIGVTGMESYAIYGTDTVNGAYKYFTKTSNPNEAVISGLEAGKTYTFKITPGKVASNGKLSYTALADVKTTFTVTIPAAN